VSDRPSNARVQGETHDIEHANGVSGFQALDSADDPLDSNMDFEAISWERTRAILLDDAKLAGPDFGARIREKQNARVAMGKEIDGFSDDCFALADTNFDGKLSLKEIQRMEDKVPVGPYKDVVSFLEKQYLKIKSLSDDQMFWEDGITKKDLAAFSQGAKDSLDSMIGYGMAQKIRTGDLNSLRVLAKEGAQSPGTVLQEFEKDLLGNRFERQLKGKHFSVPAVGKDTVYFSFQTDGWRIDVPSNPSEPVRAYSSFLPETYAPKRWQPTDVSKAWNAISREANIRRGKQSL